MCAEVGHPVKKLERVAFGPLELGSLPPGQHRRLSEGEVERLRHATGG
jgi:23S rRNA pseudouridine2605 synthase